MFKIAICDDNPKDIEVIKIIVEKFLDEKELSYSVTEFQTGEDLINSLEDFNVVFLDIVMGRGINGINAGKKFHNFNKNTKIIYTTSFAQYCEQAINNVHAFGYLTKPIEKELIINQLEDVLDLIDREKAEKSIISFEIIECLQEIMVHR